MPKPKLNDLFLNMTLEMANRAQAPVNPEQDKVSAGDAPFTSIIPLSRVVRLSKSTGTAGTDRIFDWFTKAGVVGIVAGFTVSCFAEPTMGPWLAGVVIGSPGVLLGAATLPFTRWSHVRSEALFGKVKEFQRAGLLPWLKARYGIEVFSATADALVENTLFNQQIHFSDSRGKEWNLECSEDGAVSVTPYTPAKGERFKLVKPERDQQALPDLPVIEAVQKVDPVAPSELPGEAGSLLSSVESRLSILGSYSLTTESSHAVLRAAEDKRQAIASYRKLEALGEADSAQDELVGVLTVLNNELLGIVRQEAAAVRQDLAVQGEYLRSRQQGANFGLQVVPDAEVGDRSGVSPIMDAVETNSGKSEELA